MKLKAKLRIGFSFLFIIVVAFGGISMFQIQRIAESARVILKDNYESLNYVAEMRSILDKQERQASYDFSRFEQKLAKQKNNITEPGERAAVMKLDRHYQTFRTTTSAAGKSEAEYEMRQALQRIENVNMEAIVRKNDLAQKAVDSSITLLQLVGGLTFLILFSFSVNFPGFVANPLRELLDGIREIRDGNYQKRLNFSSSDEFSELGKAFNEMANRLSDWENSNLATIRSEKLRIEAIIEQMRDAIIGVDEKGKILFVNVVAEQLLAIDSEQVVGKHVEQVAENNDLLEHIIHLDKNDKALKIFAGGKESFFQLDSIQISVPFMFEEVSTELRKSEVAAGSVFILKNVTQYKELDAAKTNIIATVSHELKTPISSIKMSLKLLGDERVGGLNPEQKQLLDHIAEDSNRLLKITGELLDLSQIESGNIQLNLTDTDPNEIVNYAVNAVRLQAEQRGIRLELVARKNLPFVYGDVEKTAWVLINFLSNALRYSPDRSRIVIEVLPSGSFIEFSVRDFGKGIEPQYQQKLFDRYFQVPADGKNKSGSGLGLAIAKDFIEAQKGNIFVESELGMGSKFGFRLPVSGRKT
ncbi:ATP-binding protein [Arcticibacter tournemirensis]